MQNNNIMDLLGLDTNSFELINIDVKDNYKFLYLSKILVNTYCPSCSLKVYSKGVIKRTINHPIMLNGYNITLIISLRRWKCKYCNHQFNDDIPFASKYKQSTNVIPIQVCTALKDLNESFVSVSRKFNISPSSVSNYFNSLVNPKRLPLPEIICIDEVFSDIDINKKYSLVLLDFITKEPIDIICSRHQNDMIPYFYSIPLEERKNVKYIVGDMYKPYKHITRTIFPNANYVVDSFHVISFLIRQINDYIVSVKRPIRKAIKELDEIKPLSSDEKKELFQLKRKLNILERFSWVILKNRSNVIYSSQLKYNSYIGEVVNTDMIINIYYNLNHNFKYIFEMKELYINFNSTIMNSKIDVEEQLNDYIKIYSNSHLKMFRLFSKLLIENKQGIINSFTYVDDRRLSNGPIESFNRKIKDTKRNARGFNDFETLRKRLLWATRKKESFKNL